jgi:hypothetical protein
MARGHCVNNPKPFARRFLSRDATSQAANNVTAMAGHWTASSKASGVKGS